MNDAVLCGSAPSTQSCVLSFFHHVRRGFKSSRRQEGASLFTLVVLCLFAVGLRGFVSGDKRGRQQDRLGPTSAHLFMSLWLHADTHTSASYMAQTYPLTPAYFTPPDSRLLSPFFPPEGSSENKGKQACFCLGRHPQAIPYHGFIQHN